MKSEVINVTEFKAKCLSLLDNVSKTGGSITITRRGKPLATVQPAKRRPWKSPEGSWAGLNIPKELLDPNTTLDWECVRERVEAEI